MQYKYTIKVNVEGGMEFETDNFESAMIIVRAIERSGEPVILSTQLAA
jgi:hypothetical protein